MSVEESLDQIINSTNQEQQEKEYTQGLGKRLGLPDMHRDARDYDPNTYRLRVGDNNETKAAKKKLRIKNIPLSTSDFLIEDLIKDIVPETKYQASFFDHKDERTAIITFDDESVMQELVDRLNGKELEGKAIIVEIFEKEARRTVSNRFSSSRGRINKSFGPRGPRGRGNRNSRGRGYNTSINSRANQNQLDRELDEYMNS
ncbi:related to RNA annealing protein YRA2 [Saccharomycodes ludwigii]|uniref:Related to RNA annealing protein YRA2 n=1 Tax=Saccharomycodes ludwigii TaxID=36035 RepID=A0A376B4P8_9ASCO|nr:hypothetical protein SCDLUD_002234 [Saccharomycodes ludwigii]KAH3902412.1 hypothetical protein SCDLUD_002234 [Saccharomycodes ludwigii]SSD59665.1 related to RNA annealing protein YRA2 [Saccharomycodes ludwigii]